MYLLFACDEKERNYHLIMHFILILFVSISVLMYGNQYVCSVFALHTRVVTCGDYERKIIIVILLIISMLFDCECEFCENLNRLYGGTNRSNTIRVHRTAFAFK